MDLLTLVMTKNGFKFGDTWWRQLAGTAMGTPCACIYATLFFSYFERTIILKKYKANILYYGRQIESGMNHLALFIDSTILNMS